MNDQLKARRRVVVPAAAMALIVSLIGGLLVLMLPAKEPAKVALKPIPPSAPSVPSVPASPSAGPATDLSMFGFGNSGADLSTPDTSGNMYASSGGFTPGPVGGLPAFQVPSMPAAQPIDWNALLEPLVQNYINAQAANVAGSVTGSVTGAVASLLNSAAVIVGDLIIFAAYTNSGPNILGQMQGALATIIPAAAASAMAAGLPPFPAPPDLTGLAAAFAAASAAPPLGVPALPALPALPTPEQLAAGLAGLSALGALPALPAIGLPPLPGVPQLPRPEEVVGGVVGGAIAIGVGGLILGALLPPPPSITRMLGLPF